MGIWDLSIAPTTWGKQLISWNASIAFLVSASPFGKLIKSLAVIRSAEQKSSFSLSPVHLPTPKTRSVVLYKFPVAIRYKATSLKGLGLEVGFACLCPFAPDGVQPNCKQTGTFASRYRNVLLAKYYLLFGSKLYARTRIVAFPEPTRPSLYGIYSSENEKNTPPFFFSCFKLQAISAFAEIGSFGEWKPSA